MDKKIRAVVFDLDGTLIDTEKYYVGLGEQIAKEIMYRLKFDNDTLRKVTKLVYYHDYRMPGSFRNVRRAMNKIGEELFPYYMQIRKADTLAQSEYRRQEKLKNLEEIEDIYQEICRQKQCVSLKTLEVKGGDLIQAGVEKGPQIGVILNRLLELVIEDPEMNKKELLLKEAEKIIR